MSTQMLFCLVTCMFGYSAGISTRDLCFDTSNFATIVTRPTFVDKTLLIRIFLEKTGQILITAPHRFGKSTNMNMIKRFLEVTVDQYGLPIDVKKDRNRTFDVSDNCDIFEKNNLKIYRDKTFFYKHCGQYPVIYIDFKLLGGNSFEIVLERFRKVIFDIFRQHCYLVKNPNLRKTFKIYYENYIDLNETQLQTGLNLLSELLYKHFNKSVFLLIDDYDAPIFDVLFDSDLEKKKTDLFFRNLITQLLRNNNYLDRVLINACPRPTTLLFVGYSRVKHFPFLDNHNFAEFYGFTETEVLILVRKFNVTDKIDSVKRYCGGFEISGRDVKVYSAWSVVHYLRDGGLKGYSKVLREESLEHFESIKID